MGLSEGAVTARLSVLLALPSHACPALGPCPPPRPCRLGWGSRLPPQLEQEQGIRKLLRNV